MYEEFQKLKEEFGDLPFEKSEFEIMNFVCNEGTPARTRRKIALQINTEVQAIEFNSFKIKECQIDIDEAKDKLDREENKYDRRRLELEIEQKELGISNSKKLVDDCLYRIGVYKKALAMTPKCNREDYEAQELPYWQARLTRDARLQLRTNGRIDTGTLKALEQAGVTVNNTDGRLEFINGRPKLLLEDKNENIS